MYWVLIDIHVWWLSFGVCVVVEVGFHAFLCCAFCCCLWFLSLWFCQYSSCCWPGCFWLIIYIIKLLLLISNSIWSVLSTFLFLLAWLSVLFVFFLILFFLSLYVILFSHFEFPFIYVVSLVLAIFTIEKDISYFAGCHIPMVSSSLCNPTHTCLGLGLVKSICIFTFAIPGLDLFIENVSKYNTLPTDSNKGMRNGFLKQCQGNGGRRIQTRTIVVSSSGVKNGVQACILIGFPSR